MIKKLRLVWLAGVVALHFMPAVLCAQDTRWSPEQVFYGSEGKLVYTPDEQGNIIPDFSHVGYMYGDEAIPDVPTVIEVSPVEGDDGASIQAAISQVEAMAPDANGFRGAVLLKKGTYQVKGQLFIRTSGVVLRGEGQTEEGTVIIADGTGKRDFIVIGNGRGRTGLTSKVNIIEDYVPIGRKYVIVDNASNYSKGDNIALYRPGTENWISDLKMDQIPDPDGTTKQWKPSSYSFYYERLVTKVNGDTIFFRNPVVMAMETKYGGGAVYKCTSDRIEKVGIEDLYLKSAYTHDADEEHAWTAVKFFAIENGWARRVTSRYFGFACVSTDYKARLITVEDCHSRDPISIITGGRRYSFMINGSLNLFRNCTTTEGRHDFVTGSRVCGPNVFTNCSAAKVHADCGPHHRWATGTLYDIVETEGGLNVQDRGASGSGHGWAGANQVFWNCSGASSICQNPWVSAKNYNFGFMGDKSPGWNERPDGVWVGHNRPDIFPASLYQAQMESRLEGGARLFSVYPSLEKVNDSSFMVSFNMPLDTSLVDAGNFTIAGNSGHEGAEFSVTVTSDTSIMVELDDIGPLPAFSEVVVKANNVLSKSGKELGGLTAATYNEPDLRPVVTGIYASVNNEDGILEAYSSKPGAIYLVKYSGNYNYLDDYRTIADLEQAVADNLGRKVDAPYADSVVMIPTMGLPAGYYLYYAIDVDGRMSDPALEWPLVEQTGPLAGLDDALLENGFKVWTSNGKIYIHSMDHSVRYSTRIFDITGRILHVRESTMGDQQINGWDYNGIIIIQMVSDKKNVEVHKLLYKPLI